MGIYYVPHNVYNLNNISVGSSIYKYVRIALATAAIELLLTNGKL